MSQQAIRRILIPVDFSDCSREALRHGLYWARALGAEIDLLHIWEPSPYVSPASLVWLNGEQRSFWEHMQRELRQQLQQLLDGVRGDDATPVKLRVMAGYVSQTILRAVEDDVYDLVVMGSHGRRGLSRWLLGSVAERVVRLAHCPVLTLHAPPKAEVEQVESPPPPA
jgi:nucleotide-binding universal stress UspA family protein